VLALRFTSPYKYAPDKTPKMQSLSTVFFIVSYLCFSCDISVEMSSTDVELPIMVTVLEQR
jgi:hypothetical protein